MSRPTSAILPIRWGAFGHADVSLDALPDGVLAVWARMDGYEEVTVSSAVTTGSVAAVLLHLREQATDALVDALGMVTFTRENSDMAAALLPQTVGPLTGTGAAS